MLGEASLDDRLAGSVPFLAMCAVATAGWQLLRQSQALAAESPGSPEARRKAAVCRFFLNTIVGEALGLRAAATAGAAELYELDTETLTA